MRHRAIGRVIGYPTRRLYPYRIARIASDGHRDIDADKQKRQAEHIEAGYEKRGVPKGKAEARAWAAVNAISGGGKKGGAASGARSSKAKTASAKKGAATRKRNAK